MRVTHGPEIKPLIEVGFDDAQAVRVTEQHVPTLNCSEMATFKIGGSDESAYALFVREEKDLNFRCEQGAVASDGIPPEVREFIFEFVDSVDQLDVLLFLRSHRDRAWSAQEVSAELRTNPASASHRLAGLTTIGLLQVEPAGEPPTYRYAPGTADAERVVGLLAEACRVRRHTVYELIFSSLKRARKFLNAFTVPGKKEDRDD